MSDELKTTITAIGKAVEEFKAQHTKEIAEIKAQGAASGETKAALDKANAAITALEGKLAEQQKAIREVETVAARQAAIPGSPETLEKERALAKPFLARARRMAADEITVTDQDLVAIRAYQPAFIALLRRGGNNGDGLAPDVRAAMSVGSDPDGGYLVPPDMSGRIVQLLYESSPMRSIASVEATRADRKTGKNDLAESGGGWVGEATARPATTSPTLGKWEIPVHEVYANPETTQKEIDDSIVDIEGWLSGKVADKLSRLEATAFVTGSGIVRPRGFTTYTNGVPSAATWNVIEQTKTGVNGGFHATLPGDVFHDVIGKTKAGYLANAGWVMNRTTLAAVRKIKDGQGNYLWEKSFQAGQPFQVLGYPVTNLEDMAAIATGSLSIGFGDFRAGYLIVDRLGIRVLRDPYTNKPFVGFYTTKRVGGDVVNFEALKLIDFSA